MHTRTRNSARNRRTMLWTADVEHEGGSAFGMKTSKCFLVGLLAATAFSAGAASEAQAQADPASVPYLISQSFLGFDPEGDGTYNSPAYDFHESNTGPRNTFVNYSGNVDGASVSATIASNYRGFFSAGNYASLTVSNARSAAANATALHGSRTSVEFFTLGPQPVRSTFTWRVTGSGSATLGETSSALYFLAGRYEGQTYTGALFGNGNPTMTWLGSGTFTYNLPLLLDQPIDLFYLSNARYLVSKDEADTVVGGTYTGTASYMNTHELVGIDLYDVNDNRIDNWTMTDRSTGQIVFNQNGRVAAAAVPEPGTLALIGPLLPFGMLALGAVVTRRRKAVTV